MFLCNILLIVSVETLNMSWTFIFSNCVMLQEDTITLMCFQNLILKLELDFVEKLRART